MAKEKYTKAADTYFASAISGAELSVYTFTNKGERIKVFIPVKSNVRKEHLDALSRELQLEFKSDTFFFCLPMYAKNRSGFVQETVKHMEEYLKVYKTFQIVQFYRGELIVGMGDTHKKILFDLLDELSNNKYSKDSVLGEIASQFTVGVCQNQIADCQSN